MTRESAPERAPLKVSPTSAVHTTLHDDAASDGAEKAEKARARKAACCKHCGAPFEPNRGPGRPRQFCSPACYRAANRERIRAWHAAYRAAHPDKARAAVAKWTAANPDKARAQMAAWHADNHFHLSLGHLDALLADHGDLCGICRGPETITSRRTGRVWRLSIDHDHGCCSDTGRSCGQCVRGILCGSCNRRLGHYEAGRQLTDIEWTAAADAYLSRYESGAIRELLAKVPA